MPSLCLRSVLGSCRSDLSRAVMAEVARAEEPGRLGSLYFASGVSRVRLRLGEKHASHAVWKHANACSRIWESVLIYQDVLLQPFEADSTKVRLMLAALHICCRPILTWDVLSKHLSLFEGKLWTNVGCAGHASSSASPDRVGSDLRTGFANTVKVWQAVLLHFAYDEHECPCIPSCPLLFSVSEIKS